MTSKQSLSKVVKLIFWCKIICLFPIRIFLIRIKRAQVFLFQQTKITKAYTVQVAKLCILITLLIYSYVFPLG